METSVAAELIAQDFFAALTHHNWHGAAQLVCPKVLANCAERWRARASALPGRPYTIEKTSGREPEMPSPVAEYLLERAIQFEREQAEWWRDELRGTTSVDELMSSTPEELMARYFASTAGSDDTEAEPVEWNILGTVMDGPDNALVVYRPQGGRRRDPDGRLRELVGWPSLLRMHRAGDRWCVGDPQVAVLHFPWILVPNS